MFPSHDLKFNDLPIYDSDKGLYSVNKASQLLGIDRQHIYYLIRKGDIRAHKKGRHYVLTYEEIERYYEENNMSSPLLEAL